MSEIGLFPLELVLFPAERVPLHIFEERYKELIGNCVADDEEFGIVLVKPSGDLHHVGTRASVTEVLEVFDDGRMHVIVAGGERFRLLEVDHDRSYDTGSVEELVDDGEPADAAALERVLDAYRRLQETIGAPGEPPELDSPLFDFQIAARIDFSLDSKQELLELTSPRTRADRLVVLIERAIEAMAVEHEMRRRAHGNGKVPYDR